jgi:hypothetical protein
MGPIGLQEGYLLGLAPGFMVLMAFMAMSTTATILITVMVDRCRGVGSRRLTTSTQMKRAMGKGT